MLQPRRSQSRGLPCQLQASTETPVPGTSIPLHSFPAPLFSINVPKKHYCYLL